MERPRFSEMLAERRRELGYSIGQASRVLRLREDVLVAFEEGDFSGMPKSGYAQGMLSSYARYLGLDASVVVDAYQDELKAYQRGSRRRGGNRGKSGGPRSRQDVDEQNLHQPRVPSRGLLPTSGGYAGDMGSFATTRVRSRASEGGGGSQAYPQGRPYTGRAPSRNTGGRSSRRNSSDIGTLQMDYSQYDDDLSMTQDALPYDAASSTRGRRRTGTGTNAERPRVSRRSSASTANPRDERTTRARNRNDRQRPNGIADLLASSQMGVVVVGVVVVLLTVIMVISVSSCINQNSQRGRSVPVSASGDAGMVKNETTATKSQQSANNNQVQPSTQNATSSTQKAPLGSAASNATTETNGTQASVPQVSVSVSVADGAATWLEISCDGKSDVAETVTGPWQRTYVVKESITVQAGDTTSVSVVQDGRQVQFDSMASGIGTIRIQNPNYTVQKKKLVTTQEDDSETSSSGTAKMGNASPNSTEALNAQSTDDSSAYDESLDAYSDYSGYYESYGNEYEGW